MDRKHLESVEAAQKRLLAVRGEVEGLGPVILGTLSRRTQKYRTADGTVKTCPAQSSLKIAGTGNLVTMRIPKSLEKTVEGMIRNGARWRELHREYTVLTSFLAAKGALKKNSRGEASGA